MNTTDFANKLFKATKKVVEDWELFEIIFFVLFLPWSLIYIAFRIFQEWE